MPNEVGVGLLRRFRCAAVRPSVRIFVSREDLRNPWEDFLHTARRPVHPLEGVDVPFGGYDH